MFAIHVRNISFRYPKKTAFGGTIYNEKGEPDYKVILRNINLGIKPGEIVCLMGESGSGKSTLLRIIGGFQNALGFSEEVERFNPDSGIKEMANLDYPLGELYFHEVPADMLNPSAMDPARDILGFVPQNCALTSNMTIYDNMALPLRYQRQKHRTITGSHKKVQIAKEEKEINNDVHTALRNVVIDEAVLTSFPHQISLGMQKRIAFARAVALNPQILLLDEPTSGLDYNSRHTLAAVIRNYSELSRVTMLIVTHDIDLPEMLGAQVAWLNRFGELRISKSLDDLDDIDEVRDLLHRSRQHKMTQQQAEFAENSLPDMPRTGQIPLKPHKDRVDDLDLPELD